MRDSKSLGQLLVNATLILLLLALVLSFSQAATAAGQKSSTPKSASRSGKTALLSSARAEGSVDLVTVKLDVGGELKFVEDKKVGREKMSVTAELNYTEKTLAVSKKIADTDAGARSVRYYSRAEAVIKAGDAGFKPTLREQRCLIAVDDATIFSPMGPLFRDELELLDIHGNSLLLDRLLPQGPVGEGDVWKHSAGLMTDLLGLDQIAECDVKSKLEKLSDGSAVMAISGRVEGAIGGVSTRMDIKAKYRFNRKTNRIDWFALLVKEDRDIGHVNAGVELVARVQMQIKPAGACRQLADAALEGLSLEASAETGQLVYRSKEGGWELSHDRRWFVQRNRAVLRLVDRGELIAQCNIISLSEVEPGEQVTLEQFQDDVKEALGESFGEFVKASQHANESDYRVLRVVAGGESSKLPIRWIYYLIADEQGRQVAITFTVEETHVERLANADRAVIETLKFTVPAVSRKM